jgi:uncharacterized protein (DUF433 family)
MKAPPQKDVIASLFKYGQSISAIAKNYKITQEAVESAIRSYMKSIDRAKRKESK